MRALLFVGLAYGAFGPTGCATSHAPEPSGPKAPVTAHSEEGLATWYGNEAGTKTASGERFRESAYTAAHRKLPFGTRVLVENLRNHKRVVVRINDRGPFSRGRIIDLSKAAARTIDMISAGVVPVRIVVIQ